MTKEEAIKEIQMSYDISEDAKEMAIETLLSQKKGKWEEHIFEGLMGNRPRTNMCNCCKYTFPIKTNYCPNCGAKME